VIALVAANTVAARRRRRTRNTRGWALRCAAPSSSGLDAADCRGLDRSHSGIVTGLGVEVSRKALTLRLHADGDAELEVWAAGRHVDPLARLLEREIRLTIAESAARTRSARPARSPRRRRAAARRHR